MPGTYISRWLVQNFKAFGPETEPIELAPITLLLGANSSGKSSLLASIRVMQQALSNDDGIYFEPSSAKLDLGKWAGLLHGQVAQAAARRGDEDEETEENQEIRQSMTLGLQLADSHAEERPTGPMSLKLEFGAEPQSPVSTCDSMAFMLGNQLQNPPTLELHAAHVYDRHPENDPPLWYLDAKPTESLISQRLAESIPELRNEVLDLAKRVLSSPNDPGDKLIAPLVSLVLSTRHGRPLEFAGLDQFLERCKAEDRPPPRAVDWFQRHLKGELNQALEQSLGRTSGLLSHFQHIAPLREPPRRFYSWSESESDIRGTGAGLHGLLSRRPNLLPLISNDFKKLEINLEIELREFGLQQTPYLITYELRPENDPHLELSLCDVGQGVSQVLPILASTRLEEIDIASIEQPELHLHPRQQASLMDVLMNAVLSNESSLNQVILETHSEPMLLRLKRRIREGLQRDQVAIIAIENLGDGRGSRARRLEIAEDGTLLDPLPQSFSNVRLNDQWA
ncbi:MAG: AAA family ATPase [Acidobacteriota bacterium]